MTCPFMLPLVAVFALLGALTEGQAVAGSPSDGASPNSAADHAKLVSDFREDCAPYLNGVQSRDFQYKATERYFGHFSRPFETREVVLFGNYRFQNGAFVLTENQERRGTIVRTLTRYTEDSFFVCDADRTPRSASTGDHAEFVRLSCRYSPVPLLRYVLTRLSESADRKKHTTPEILIQDGELIVLGSHNAEDFEIHFSQTDSVLNRIVWTTSHEMWGDQKIEINYDETATSEESRWPTRITERTLDTETFSTNLLSVEEARDTSPIAVPDDYKLEEEPSADMTIAVEEFSDHVTFLTLNHTASRTTLVEFSDFLVVIEAPIRSANGQLIIDKVKELKPDKPIRYFAFGHHHPHYLGGVRPFIAEGARVLSSTTTEAYVRQLADFQHTRQPDRLQRSPKPLVCETFDQKKVITDGTYVMEIHDIGLNSLHTVDYQLFYFPEEKMVLQGDGIFVRPNRPASARTKAIYDAIVDLKLDVVDCVQSWPTHGYNVETKIKFKDLQKAVATVDDDR